jgi:hypothetical protein
MFSMKLLSALALVPFLFSCAGGPDSAGVVQLFDGESLAGWTVEVGQAGVSAEGIFSASDGLLVCKGEPTAVLRSVGEYEDYELLLEWRWAPGTEGGNSGLLLHCSTPRHHGVWPRSIEAQLKSGSAAGFYLMGDGVDISVTGDPARRSGSWIPREVGEEKPVGEWNQMRVRCEGDSMLVYLNGVLANEGSGASEVRGAVALQSEGAPIHFRRVELRRLDG